MSRVVVIGAGVGGLASAALLAAQGHDVTVVEQAARVGGKLGVHVRDGVHFDTGPSLLTLPDVLHDVFERTGGWPESLVLRELSPIATVRFADGTEFAVSSDRRAFHAELERWSPGAGDDWFRFRDRAERIWELTREPFLSRELHGARTLAALALRHPLAIRVVAPGRTLADLGARHLRDPRLRQFLWRYATYTGSDPRRAPAALAAIPHAEQQYGGWYVRGGLTRLADALATRCMDLRVTVNLNLKVRKVLVRRGRVRGIALADGSEIEADVVVSDVDARHLYGDLVRHGRARRRVEAAPRSYSGFVLLLGIRGDRPAGLAHHTVLFPQDYTAEFDDLRRGAAVDDPAIYCAAPDDPGVRSPTAYPMFVLVNAPRQDQYDWDEAPSGRRRSTREAYADRLLDLMAGRGLDVRDRLSFIEIRTPADLERATFAPGGAIYGTSGDGPRSAFLRPANSSPILGLYLVGGSAHPGGGIPLVLLSARIVADVIGPAS